MTFMASKVILSQFLGHLNIKKCLNKNLRNLAILFRQIEWPRKDAINFGIKMMEKTLKNLNSS